MARKVTYVKLAAFLAAIVLVLSVSFVNMKLMNTSALAEEEILQAAETESDPQTAEADAVPAETEEAAPQVTEAAEEPAPEAVAEPEPAKEPEPAAAPEPVKEPEPAAAPEPVKEPEPAAAPENHQENAQPETTESGGNQETDDGDEWFTGPEEDGDLEIIEDDDAGTVSEEMLEPFNNPDFYRQEVFTGTAEIRLMNEGMLNYGDEIILKADVRDVNVEYRLVWEANDNDGYDWYTIAGGEEYRFVLTRENAAREYRVVICAVG